MAVKSASLRALPQRLIDLLLAMLVAFEERCVLQLLPSETLQQLADQLQTALLPFALRSDASERTRRCYCIAWELVWSTLVIRIKSDTTDALSLIRRYGLLLDMGLLWGEHSLADSFGGSDMVFVTILADILDLSTIRACTQIFDYVHGRIDRIAMDVRPRSKKAYLSICTNMLRRATSILDPKCVSNVLLFTSKVFPLDDKGLFNVRGTCNTSLVTVIDDIIDQDTETLGEQTDMNQFYKLLWSIQWLLEDPRTLLSVQRDPLNTFLSNVDTVIGHFLKVSETLGEYIKQSRPGHTIGTRESDNIHRNDRQFFTSKFLTSRELFDEQVTDPYFRRQILVQYLIVFEFLLFYTDDNMKAQTKAFGEDKQLKKNNNMLLSKGTSHLTTEEAERIKNMRAKIIVVLSKIPPDGIAFVEMLLHLLKQEAIWLQWKLRFCSPEFVVRGDSPLVIADKMTSYTAQMEASFIARKDAILPEDKRTLEEVLAADETRIKRSSLEQWTEDIEGEFEGNDEYGEWHKSNKPFWVWQAMRLWSEHDFKVLGKPVTANGIRDFYRRWKHLPEETEEEKAVRLAAQEAEVAKRREIIGRKRHEEEQLQLKQRKHREEQGRAARERDDAAKSTLPAKPVIGRRESPATVLVKTDNDNNLEKGYEMDKHINRDGSKDYMKDETSDKFKRPSMRDGRTEDDSSVFFHTANSLNEKITARSEPNSSMSSKTMSTATLPERPRPSTPSAPLPPPTSPLALPLLSSAAITAHTPPCSPLYELPTNQEMVTGDTETAIPTQINSTAFAPIPEAISSFIQRRPRTPSPHKLDEDAASDNVEIPKTPPLPDLREDDFEETINNHLTVTDSTTALVPDVDSTIICSPQNGQKLKLSPMKPPIVPTTPVTEVDKTVKSERVSPSRLPTTLSLDVNKTNRLDGRVRMRDVPVTKRPTVIVSKARTPPPASSSINPQPNLVTTTLRAPVTTSDTNGKSTRPVVPESDAYGNVKRPRTPPPITQSALMTAQLPEKPRQLSSLGKSLPFPPPMPPPLHLLKEAAMASQRSTGQSSNKDSTARNPSQGGAQTRPLRSNTLTGLLPSTSNAGGGTRYVSPSLMPQNSSVPLPLPPLPPPPPYPMYGHAHGMPLPPGQDFGNHYAPPGHGYEHAHMQGEYHMLQPYIDPHYPPGHYMGNNGGGQMMYNNAEYQPSAEIYTEGGGGSVQYTQYEHTVDSAHDPGLHGLPPPGNKRSYDASNYGAPKRTRDYY